MEVHYFRDSAVFARRLARALGVPARGIRVHRFPDGESLVEVDPEPPAQAVLVRQLHDPNGKLLELLMAADALRHAGVRRIALAAPYLPYMRQDRVFAPGQPHSQQVLGRLLGERFERVLTVEPHLHRTRRLGEVVPGRAVAVSAAPCLAPWVRRQRSCFLVGPDEESEGWVRRLAREAGVAWVVACKERLSDRRVRVVLPALPGYGKAILLDDIVSSGSTLAVTARALRARGVARVEAIVVHALVDSRGLARLKAAGVSELHSCDSVPHPTNRFRVAPLLAARLGARH